jgi:hypothetical protein
MQSVKIFVYINVGVICTKFWSVPFLWKAQIIVCVLYKCSSNELMICYEISYEGQ